MTDPAIQIRDVEIRYGDVVAVREVSLSIPPGEIHALLGKSGSGKTTLLRAIAGFEPIHAGAIDLYGEVVDAPEGKRRTFVPPERRRIGLVFQDYALFPHLTVGENIAFGMTSRDPARISAWLERVGLAGYNDRPPSALSGGEQQRVALARALASAPRLMLFDEPFSNLDMALRRKLRRQTMELLRQEQIAAVFVTHDAGEAFALGHRLSVMHQSRLLQSGTAAAIYETPVSREVAMSVGDALFLDADRIEGQVAQCALGQIPLRPESAEGGTLMLRPAQIRVTAPGAPQPPDSVTVGAGAVVGRTYLGHSVSVEVEVHGLRLEALAATRDVPSGDAVAVHVQGQAMLVP